MMRFFELHCEVGEIRRQLSESWNTPRQWALIRRYYKLVEPIFLDRQRLDPYWPGIKISPIEHDVWCEIRLHGLPFYPQYPVGRRFVDFGDPARSIAIEVDGAAFHSPEKDAQKNAELLEHGWRVFRIKGKHAYHRADNLRDVLQLYGKHLVEEEEYA